MANPFGRIFGGTHPAVNIQRAFYSMATVDGDEAEIVMYGDIVQDIPRNWWTNEPVDGNYIILEEFLNDLTQIAGVKRLTLRINSCGGDAYAAIPIHNRLRELKAEVVAIVDGVAMSGGSLIMCAADTVKVNPSSLVMIHRCWSVFWGYYNADELRRDADALDAVDRSQVVIYKRKTGMGDEELLKMMSDCTYMTGVEAKDRGFADEVTEDEPASIAASADLRTLFVNGRIRRFPFPLSGLPESIPTVKAEAEQTNPDVANKNQPAAPGGERGGKPMAKTLEELRKEDPELADALMAEARTAASAEAESASGKAVEGERARLKEIDEVAALFDDETVREAKYGERPCTAQEMAYRAAQNAVQSGKRFMSELQDDNANSGAQEVPAAPGVDDEGGDATPDQKMANARAQVKGLLGKTDKGDKQNG